MPVFYKFSGRDLIRPRDPADLGLSFTSLRRIELAERQTIELYTKLTEAALVVLEGNPLYTASLFKDTDAKRPTGPDSPVGTLAFQDVLFIPPHAAVSMEGPGVLILFEAPSELGASFAHIRFDDIKKDPARHKTYGKPELGTLRHVWHAVDDQFPCSRLMLGFCQGSAGGWTAWPPHEHGDEREEVYVYYGMGKGFGIQCVYRDLSEPGIAVVVRDGDAVSIPEGYHPNVGSPAGGIQYIYCMTARMPGKRTFMDLRVQKEYGETFE